MKTFGKINAPDVAWEQPTTSEARRMTLRRRHHEYVALRRLGFNSGTWWQRAKFKARLTWKEWFGSGR